jgi:hypothetical protein
MKTSKILFSVVATLLLSASVVLAGNDGLKGNGLPKSKLLYNLEIIAYDGNNCPSGDMTGTNTHRIAVQADVNDTTFGSNGNNPGGTLLKDLVRQNDIMLTAGDDFQVLDGNACDDGVAEFQLPTDLCSVDLSEPCDLQDPTFQSYTVYARLVGKPGTGVQATTCASYDPGTPSDPTDDYIVCSTDNWLSVRESKQPKFTDVSKDLLSICLDTSVPADGTCDVRYALFAPELYDYFWNWNTQGKAHAQLFFMSIPD